jgi:hypothetical protein
MPEPYTDRESDLKKLRADHVGILAAMQLNACALPDASEELHADHEIVMTAPSRPQDCAGGRAGAPC